MKNIQQLMEKKRKSVEESTDLFELSEDKIEDFLSKYDSKKEKNPKDLPAIIILKRKAIRVYPDNQKVALYYSQQLDRYITIPYGKGSKSMGISEQVTENDFSKPLTPEQKKALEKDAVRDATGDVAGAVAGGVAGGIAAKLGAKALPALAKAAGQAAGAAAKTGKALAKGSAEKMRATAQAIRAARASKAGRTVSGLGKLAGKGVVGLGAAALSALSSDKDKRLFHDTNVRDDFTQGGRGIQNTVVAAPNQVTPSAAEIRANKQMWGINPSQKNVQESNLNVIREMVEQNISEMDIPVGDQKITLNNRVSKKILKVYESLNKHNKAKMERMLNENAITFRKAVNFAVKQ